MSTVYSLNFLTDSTTQTDFSIAIEIPIDQDTLLFLTNPVPADCLPLNHAACSHFLPLTSGGR